MDEQSSPPPLHAAVGAALVAALVLSAGWVGYELRPARVEYVDHYIDRIVKEPHEVRVEVPVDRPVPGPTVYVPVPGPTIVKKILVRAPRHCPTSDAPSIADALNEYEALDHKERNFQCRKTL